MHGFLTKMRGELISGLVHYHLDLDQPVAMNHLLGQNIRISFKDAMRCVGCGRSIKKTFQQGYCFPCVQTKAACDMCILKPELCHYHRGTCREPTWGESHCMQKHVVYLANTSGLKVGITRFSNIPQRFIDQGATQALPVLEVESRYESGLLEVEIAKELNDKTNWRKMLQADAPDLDLTHERDKVFATLKNWLNSEGVKSKPAAIPEIFLRYPILQYPQKVVSLNLDKTPIIEGVLQGIKGQYLLLSTGVFNVRNATGYAVELKTQL